jgi:hypothetical protein
MHNHESSLVQQQFKLLGDLRVLTNGKNTSLSTEGSERIFVQVTF